MANIRLILAYDGGEFFGFQKTKMGRSVEETLQRVLETILQHPVTLQAASRTDRGVHALNQVVNFFSEKVPDLLSVNRLLPKDVVVRSLDVMSESFHPTLDCVKKEYHYQLCYGAFQLPQHRYFSWHKPCPALDVEAMRTAAQQLIGTHDFSALCLNRKMDEYDDCVRTLEAIEIEELGDQRIVIKVIGNAFFYKMVRTIVGTLVNVGEGELEVDSIRKILAQRNRALAGVTAPPHGLTLMKVYFSE